MILDSGSLFWPPCIAYCLGCVLVVQGPLPEYDVAEHIFIYFFLLFCLNRRFDDRSRWRCSAGHIRRINDADLRLLSPTSVSIDCS